MIPWLAIVAAAAPPPELDGVGIEEHLGRQVPLDARFTDPNGVTRPLGAWLGDEPVVLALAYYRCRMLCDVIVREAAAAVGQLEDRRFRTIVVSFDPDDTPATALRARGELEWPFLVGEPPEIGRLLDAVGLTVRKDDASGQIAHPAALYVLTPQGRISRYLYGPRPDPTALAEALEAARAEETGPSLGAWVLSCFRWTPADRVYRPRLEAFLRIGGVAVFSGVFLVVGGLVLRTRQRAGRGS